MDRAYNAMDLVENIETCYPVTVPKRSTIPHKVSLGPLQEYCRCYMQLANISIKATSKSTKRLY